MDTLLILAGLLLLVAGAETTVRGALALGSRAGLSPLVMGLTIVAMGTSAPELVVSLLAALDGKPVIAVGNVLGSNIANISLVLGLAVLVFPVEVDRAAHKWHWPVMLSLTLVLWWATANGAVSRAEGVILLVLFTAYLARLVSAGRRVKVPAGTSPAIPAMGAWIAVALVSLGTGALALGAHWLVRGAVGIARELGSSEQLIGLTVVAVGTSLPELVTSLVAAFRKQPDISLGNLIGSNIFNISGIIGITAVTKPIVLAPGAFTMDIIASIAVAVLLYPLMRSGSKLGRWQGAVLVLAYGAYLYLVIRRG